MREGGREGEKEREASCCKIQTFWVSRALIIAVDSVGQTRPPTCYFQIILSNAVALLGGVAVVIEH